MRINGQEVLRVETEPGDGNPTMSNGKRWVAVVSPGITSEDVVELNFGNQYLNAYIVQFDELLNQMLTGDESLLTLREIGHDFIFVDYFCTLCNFKN